MKAIIVLSLILATSCSSKKPEKRPIIYPQESQEVSTTKPKDPSITARQVAAEQGSHLVTEFKFPKGKAEISGKNKKKIRELFRKAKREGRVDEVQLITWADHEYPGGKKHELTSDQKRLVEKRNEALERYLQQLDREVEVTKVSMAEKAGALDRFTASDEAKVKNTLQTKDAPSRASQSMVIFILK